eukprot:Nk52_evm2s261 gene=Nk52_evmTU2s261
MPFRAHSSFAANGKVEAVKGDLIYSFGGFSTRRLSSTSFFNTTSRTWHTLSTTGASPPARLNAMGAISGNYFIVYGGLGSGSVVLDDLHSLDLTTFNWVKRGAAMANSPGPRYAGSAWEYQDNLYFFGGQKDKFQQNDLHMLDVAKWTFSKISYRCADGSTYAADEQTSVHEASDESLRASSSCKATYLTINPKGPPDIPLAENFLAVDKKDITTAKATITTNQTSFNTDEALGNTLLAGGLALLAQVNAGSGSAAIQAKLTEYKAFLDAQKTTLIANKPSTKPSWAYTKCGDWRCRTNNCAVPSPRSGTAVSVEGKAAYVSGGSLCKFSDSIGIGCYDAAVWKLDMETFQWTNLYNQSNPSGTVKLLPFFFHGQTTYRGQLCIWGGGYVDAAGDFNFYNTPYLFNLTTNTFSIMSTRGTVPDSRFEHGLHSINDKIYILGGRKFPNIHPTESATIIPSNVLPGSSTASGPGIETSGEVGYERTFTVQIEADVGTYWAGGDQVNCAGFGKIKGFFTSSITDNNNGTYTITYRATTSGNYSVAVTVNSEDIKNSPFTVIINPGPIVGSNSVLLGNGVSNSSATRTTSENAIERSTTDSFSKSFLIQPRDQYSNGAVLPGNYSVSFKDANTNADLPSSVFSMTRNSNNSYTVSYSLGQGSYLVFVNYIDANGTSTSFLGSPYRLNVPADSSSTSLVPFIAGGAAGGVVLIILVILFIRWKKQRDFEKSLADLTWVIDYEDLTVEMADHVGKSMKSIQSAKSGGSAGTVNLGKKHCQVCTYEGNVWALKSLNTEDSIILNREIVIDCLHVRECNHENVARFGGLVVEGPNASILWEYGNKGSLQDMLLSDGIQIDWMLKYSLATDIALGLSYLHSSKVKSHGRLHAQNVIVDGKWIAKLTDFGMPSIFALEDELTEEEEMEQYYNILTKKLFIAPEILEDEELVCLRRGTTTGDIYSFSMVLTEIIIREGPYDSFMQEKEEILERILKKNLRPNVHGHADIEVPGELVELLHQCWHEVPSERPSAQEIAAKIKGINPHGNQSILDNMASILEQYTNNLEGLVNERTKDLEKEKERSEEIVLQMLPRSVYEALKEGEVVKAEQYECVSLYFSDIVGFTSIAGKSKPNEIVVLLNSLYSLFDGIIGLFDAYKVETIGDAYMVASGVPERNGNDHAVQLCSLAYCLMQAIPTLKIQHLPDEELKLRAGCHSGAVTAGVVGVKMPRYCLFGATVGYASSMESSSLHMRTQVSETMHELLRNIPGFSFEPTSHRSDDDITFFIVDVPHNLIRCTADGTPVEVDDFYDGAEDTQDHSFRSSLHSRKTSQAGRKLSQMSRKWSNADRKASVPSRKGSQVSRKISSSPSYKATHTEELEHERVKRESAQSRRESVMRRLSHRASKSLQQRHSNGTDLQDEIDEDDVKKQ